MRFDDRSDAGGRLGKLLSGAEARANVLVLGLPRGGVPVAAEVAQALNAPLDVLVVRKLGVPRQPELAFGAIGEGGARYLNENIIHQLGLTQSEMTTVESREREELEGRVQAIRKSVPRISLLGRSAIVVDDGLATGATAHAACKVARSLGASRVTLAVPTAPRRSRDQFSSEVDEFVCVHSSRTFGSVGEWYVDFAPTSDEEVLDLLLANRSGANRDGAAVDER